MRQWVLLLGAIACEVTGSLSLKTALDRPWFYALVAVAYVASFVLLAAVLRAGMGLGVAYGIWGALGVAATAVLSWLVFDEGLTAPMVLGLGLVIAGVLLVEVGQHRAAVDRARVEAG
jgi:small multidrug resistance pump